MNTFRAPRAVLPRSNPEQPVEPRQENRMTADAHAVASPAEASTANPVGNPVSSSAANSAANPAAKARTRTDWFAVRRELSTKRRWTHGIGAFLLPILVWCIVSYVPFVWHPQMLIGNPGSVDYFQPGMRIDKATFNDELATARAKHAALPTGIAVNPVYLPAPHEVLRAFYTAFTTPPASRDGPWLHQSL